ncbi:hypothetical protein SH1V18_15180 [Vallitalea longa]|uniref:Uncharacterized protein n=1 Tax=Vallitalea longa TaxID=2936439 RepID=A0A9W5YD46_9FIRM|nr:hypothetical protein [Vallitalea longa]GKX29038.1 hypothetical protein SH1V18_15180 [Vallitalea longa]
MSNKLKKLLTFNEDNKEVLELLNNKSNASQYVCEAVRFYEQNKNVSIDLTRIEDKINLILSKSQSSNSVSNESTDVTAINKADTDKSHNSIKQTNQVQEIQPKIDNELKDLILSEED